MMVQYYNMKTLLHTDPEATRAVGATFNKNP